MNSTSFFLVLRERFDRQTFARLFLALRQDKLIWELLSNTPLGEKAVQSLPADISTWQPGALALWSLRLPLDARTSPDYFESLSPPFQRLLKRTWEDWQNNRLPAALDLNILGLLALSLFNDRRVQGDWGAARRAAAAGLPHLQSVFACLAGLLPSLINACHEFLKPDDPPEYLELFLHAGLTLPLTPYEHAELFEDICTGLPGERRLQALRFLWRCRPTLGRALAESSTLWLETIKTDCLPTEEGDHLRSLSQSLLRAEISQYRLDPEQAMQRLADGLRSGKKLQALMNFRLAQAAVQAEQITPAVDAWKQAAQFDADSPDYAVAYSLALLQHGDAASAHAFLRTRQPEIHLSRPVLLLAAAQMMIQMGEVEQAHQALQHALEAWREVKVPGSLAEPAQSGQDHEIPAKSYYSGSASSHNNFDLAFLLAKVLYEMGYPRQAAEVASAALEIEPAHTGALQLQVKALLNCQEAAAALAPAYQAVLLAADRPGAQRLWVEALRASRAWKIAYEEMELLLSETPSVESADLLNLSDLAIQAGQTNEAKNACERILEKDPDNSNAYLQLGRAYLLEGESLAALDYLRKATQLAPRQAEPWLALAEAQRAAGQTAKALETLRVASQAVIDDPQVYLALGEAYFQEGAATQALAYLRQAAALSQPTTPLFPLDSHSGKQGLPPNFAAHLAYRLGQVLHYLGHTEEASQVLAKEYRSDPELPEYAIVYGRVLIALNRFSEAVDPLETAIEGGTADATVYIDLARILLQNLPCTTESARKAAALLDHVLEQEPGYLQAKALRAEACLALEDYQTALQEFRILLETDLIKTPAWRTQLNLGFGKAALEVGQTEAAVAALQEAQQADTPSLPAARALATAYMRLGVLKESMEAAKSALQLHSTDPENLIWFAQHALQVNERPGGAQLHAHSEALAALQRAVKVSSDNPSLLSRLGTAQMQAGDLPGARETLGNMIKTLTDRGSTGKAGLEKSVVLEAARNLRKLGEPQAAVRLLKQFLYPVKEYSGMPKSPLSEPDLMIELAESYEQAGDSNAALHSLDQAARSLPESAELIQRKVDLLWRLGRTGDARCAALEALEGKTKDIGLLARAAVLLRLNGELGLALQYASEPLQYGSSEESQEMAIFCRTMAAEIAFSLLLNSLGNDLAFENDGPSVERKALSSLFEQAQSVVDANQEYSCSPADALRSLMLADLELNSQAIDSENKTTGNINYLQIVLRNCPSHPRSLALQARFNARHGQVEAAKNFLNSAIAALDEAVGAFPGGSWQFAFDKAASLRSLAIAAAELGVWDAALDLAQKAAECAPLEPISHALIASLLEQRAEQQRLCEDLEVVYHAPGAQALGEEAQQRFESAIKDAENSLALAWESAIIAAQTEENQDQLQTFQAYFALGREEVQRRKVRGRAVFQPSEEAAAEFYQMLKNSKTSPEEIAALIASMARAGRITSIQDLAQDAPHHPVVFRQLALAYENDDPRQAFIFAASALNSLERQAFERAEEAPLLHFLLSRLDHRHHVHLNNQFNPRQSIEKALAAWPQEPRWRSLAGEIYLSPGDNAEPADSLAALKHWKQALELEPERQEHALNLGRLYRDRGEWEEAVDVLQQAVERHADQHEAWLALAEAQLAGGLLEEAQNSADKAAELAEKAPEVLALSGEIALKNNQYAKARQYALSALETQADHAGALLVLARALEGLEMPGMALEALEKAIPKAKDPLPLHLERARLLKRHKGIESAVRFLHELAEASPDEPLILAPLAELLMEAGEGEPALKAARQALHDEDVKLSGEERARLHYLIGRQLHKSGQLDQAVYHLSEAILQWPADMESYLELGKVYQERRQHAQALRIYQQAVRLAGEDYRPFYYAGQALKETKDYQQAESMLRKAVELAPQDVNVHRLLGAVVALNLVHNRQSQSIGR